MPRRKPTPDDVNALRALLESYRGQTTAVGGAGAGERFDTSPLVQRAAEALRVFEATVQRERRPP